MKEMAVLGHAMQVVRGEAKPKVDMVVLDAPATGHGMSLLWAPLLVSEVLGKGPLGRLAGEVADMVRDPEQVAVVIGTTAEEMPVQEALELIAGLRERLGRPPELLVVNGLYPAFPNRTGQGRCRGEGGAGSLAAQAGGQCARGAATRLGVAWRQGGPSTARTGAGSGPRGRAGRPFGQGARAGGGAMSLGILDRPLLLVVGAGGVGKTTLAAALGLTSAAEGTDTLVMTFDPSHRLKDALGVGEEAVDREVPVEVDTPGRLDVSLLNARRTFDELVSQYAPSEAAAERIFQNRFYHHLAGNLAGILEYMAVERLFEVSRSGRYQRIILDTPPTRQALDFLGAPDRMVEFLRERAGSGGPAPVVRRQRPPCGEAAQGSGKEHRIVAGPARRPRPVA